MKSKLDIKRIALVSLIYCSLDVMWMMYNSYVPIYLQAGNPSFSDAGAGITGFGLNPTISGFLMTIDNIGALLIAPLIGILSDSCRSKMGRRMPFVVFAMPFMVLSLILMPLFVQMIPADLNGQTAKLTSLFVPFILTMIILLISNAVMAGPGRAMLFDITPSEQRTTANGICNVLDGIFCIIIILGGAVLYEIYKPLPLWISGVFILIVILFVLKLIKEPSITDTSASEIKTTPKQIIQILSHLPKDYAKSTIYYLVSILFAYLGLSIGQAFISSYAVSVLKVDVSTASILLAIMMVVALISAIPAAMLANRFGRKRMMMIGSFICALVCVLLYSFTSLTVTMIGIGLFGLAWILTNISHSPVMTDLAPSEKYLGTYIGLLTTITTLAMIIGPTVGGWIVEKFNHDYNAIWPIMIVFFVISIFTLIPVTKGEAKKASEQIEEIAIPAE